jgi:hypothetical protein
MSLMHPRRSVPAMIALTVLAAAATASAATTTVRLNLQGGYGNRTLRACGLTHHYTLYHRAEAIAVNGAIAPAPTRTVRLKLKIKQCVNGRFLTVWAGSGHIGANGTYSGSLTPRRRGFYFARAYYEGATTVKSDKEYFRAT